MKQSTKRLFSVLFSLFLIGGAFLLFSNFIRPAYQEAQKIKGDVQARQQFVLQQQEVVRKVQQLVSSYNNEADLRNLVSLTLPLERDVSGALTQLGGLVQDQTLGAQSFAITPQQNDAPTAIAPPSGSILNRPLGTLLFQFSFSGSYDNLKSFLEKLESNVRIFDVRTLSLVPVGKSTQDIYKVDLTVVTYYQPKQ